MRCVVFCYHNMGVLGLESLLAAGFEVVLVLSHQDDPHENLWFDSVADFCAAQGLECITPANPNTPEVIAQIQAAQPEIIFSFYYRHMLCEEILNIAPQGAYNLHGSYLPAYRGRCPVNWVIVNGETSTGVTLHEMVVKPDAGAIVNQKRVAITDDDTARTLFTKLEQAARELLAETLPRMAQGDIPKTPMDLSAGSYYGGRRPADGRIDWNATARAAYNLIRGVTRPYPGAFGLLGGEPLIIWRALPVAAEGPAGEIVERDGRLLIACAEGALEPREIEYRGQVLEGPALSEFLSLHEGEVLK
ncbi:MAG: Bifunctional polymyxin resistance protein ArnA [Deltaproteobacteria bacterium ADurb.Bin510]|nr:MAG: Bifunctional polymyxin resistance protein ArnA [Deltaproteobacteria bacterium ADurb.Bin510]